MQATHAERPQGELERLRAQVERMQGRRLDAPPLPTHPALARLLPGGGLRPGAAYSIAPSSALLFTLLSAPTQAGSWCAAVGMPELGVEAGERLGVDLDRLVLIPDPGARWLAVTATIADVLPVVALRPPGRVTDGQVSRLAARLRDKGVVLLVQGAWPQVDATISLEAPRWSGLGSGHGYLDGREFTVTVSSRRRPAAKRGRMLLPDRGGHATALSAPVGGGPVVERDRGEQRILEAVS
jgi:hypothetical protein